MASEDGDKLSIKNLLAITVAPLFLGIFKQNLYTSYIFPVWKPHFLSRIIICPLTRIINCKNVINNQQNNSPTDSNQIYTQAIYQEYPVQLDNIIKLGLCTSDGFTIIYSSISLKQQSASKKVTITLRLYYEFKPINLCSYSLILCT